MAQWLSGFGHTAPGRQQATGGAGTGLIKSNTPLIEFNTPLIKSNAPLEELPPQGTKGGSPAVALARNSGFGVALEHDVKVQSHCVLRHNHDRQWLSGFKSQKL